MPAAGTPLLLGGCSGQLSILDPAGPSAHSAATLWWGMLILFTLVMAAVVGLWLYATRRNPGAVSDAEAARVHRRLIVGGGLVLPIVSIAVILAFGIPAGHRMLPLPLAEGEPLSIEVTARRWSWQVRYPADGVTLENEMHIPAGAPVDVRLSSEDVIHSFWVPRLAGKLDTIPGRTHTLRLQADEPDTYHGQCAEFCGRGHVAMRFVVHAHSADDFDNWLREARSND